jgi:hypothetical protein
MDCTGNANICQLAENLRALALHPDEIAAGRRLTAADLTAAPVIENWEPKLTTKQGPVIRGVVFGHVSISDGEDAPRGSPRRGSGFRWIRSWASHYRLGREAEMQIVQCAPRRAR